jgi:chromate transporter
MKKNIFNIFNIFFVFFKLGLKSFGGPVAHIGYFRSEFVEKRKWLTESEFLEIVTLCQFLPGPASSQIGITIGFLKERYFGAILAWLGFTLPSAAIMIFFAISMTKFNFTEYSGLIKGVIISGGAVVLQACVVMIKNLCPDFLRKTMAALSALIVILIDQVWAQFLIIFISGLFGFFLIKENIPYSSNTNIKFTSSKKTGFFWITIFLILLMTLFFFQRHSNLNLTKVMFHFFNTGSTVFGGGHVVLPLIQNYLTSNSLISNEIIMTGYGLTQVIPGPLFTFSAFIGASLPFEGINPILSGVICCFAIFLPSFFLVFSAIPFWQEIKQNKNYYHIMSGINAGVVGLLISVLYQPFFVSEIKNISQVILLALAFSTIFFTRMNLIYTFLFCAISGYYFL